MYLRKALSEQSCLHVTMRKKLKGTRLKLNMKTINYSVFIRIIHFYYPLLGLLSPGTEILCFNFSRAKLPNSCLDDREHVTKI